MSPARDWAGTPVTTVQTLASDDVTSTKCWCLFGGIMASFYLTILSVKSESVKLKMTDELDVFCWRKTSRGVEPFYSGPSVVLSVCVISGSSTCQGQPLCFSTGRLPKGRPPKSVWLFQEFKVR